MPRGPKPLKKRLANDEFYCLHCRKRCVGDNIKEKIIYNYKRGSFPMQKAVCTNCGYKVCKIVG